MLYRVQMTVHIFQGSRDGIALRERLLSLTLPWPIPNNRVI